MSHAAPPRNFLGLPPEQSDPATAAVRILPVPYEATVYRTLDLLAQSGMITLRDFGEGFRRYERAPGRQHHEHLICIRCGTVIEFVNERLERMKALIAEEHGFRHHHHRLEIFGTCPECQQRDGVAPPPPSGPR